MNTAIEGLVKILILYESVISKLKVVLCEKIYTFETISTILFLLSKPNQYIHKFSSLTLKVAFREKCV